MVVGPELCVLPRTYVLGTRVNRDVKKGRSTTPGPPPSSPLTSLGLGKTLRLAREVHSNVGIVAHDPGIVSQADYVYIPATRLLLGAVLVDHVYPASRRIPRMKRLAAIGPCEGLDGLRPSPPHPGWPKDAEEAMLLSSGIMRQNSG